MKPSVSPITNPVIAQSISESNKENSQCQAKSTLVISNINEKFNLSVYPHCVVYKFINKVIYPRPRILKKRSNIKTFSKKARFRMFTTLAKITENHVDTPLFLTLTYHYGHEAKFNDTKSNLHHFFVRLRDIDPDVQFIWRFEFQKRGAPHYHVILFPGDPCFRSNQNDYNIIVSRIWHEIADPKSRSHKEYGCKTVVIDSYRKACAYVSKYIAKVDAENCDREIGKHWGNSRNLPFDVLETAKGYASAARPIIEKLRKYLIKNGKSQYADPIYFNEKRDQVVFIDYEKFQELTENPLIESVFREKP